MNTYQIVSTVGALILYIPLALQILQGKARQNAATFILWGSLDAIAAVSIYIQGGNWHLPAAYTAGCALIVVCLVIKGYIEWTPFETKTTFLVVICLVGWYLSGPYLATILSTAGVVIAGFPQIKDTWKRPEHTPTWLYPSYTVVNIISTVGGSAWTVEERLYPLCCAIMCGIVAILSFRKFHFFKPHSA